MDIIRFESPNILWLLLLLVPMVVYYWYKHKSGKATVVVSTIVGLSKLPKGFRYYLRHAPMVLRMVAMTLIIVAMARPQSALDNQTVSAEGVDIVLALDVSGSMLARDFKPDRITASKEVASQFILDRPTDRLGIVVFAGESYTQAPLTTDHATLINLLGEVKSGIIEDGTAIGNGLATAISRLKDSPAKSKVVILLTDGVNNRGQVAPLTSAEIAQTLGVKVYTIGVGTNGTAPYPTIDMWGNTTFVQSKVEIDEEVLTKISEMTGGKYFRATNNSKLKEIYDEINALEKTKIDVESFTIFSEQYKWFVVAALVAVVLEMLTRYLLLRQIP